jgi:hypothetical protein
MSLYPSMGARTASAYAVKRTSQQLRRLLFEPISLGQGLPGFVRVQRLCSIMRWVEM